MNEFDDLTDLDDVFGPLRSVARPAELSQENATVDLMVKAHRTSEGKHMFTSRRARIATLVATGVLGFGGMAAASSSPGVDDPVEVPVVEVPVVEVPVVEVPVVEVPVVEVPVVEEPVVEEPVVEEPVVEEPVIEEPVVEEPVAGDPDPDTAFDENTCRPGNHGKTVSAVARGEFPGVSVTDAAHSSCGKSGEVEEPEVEETEPEPEETELEELEADHSEAKADRPDKSDKGAEKAANRNSNGNGNGKGNRNRDD